MPKSILKSTKLTGHKTYEAYNTRLQVPRVHSKYKPSERPLRANRTFWHEFSKRKSLEIINNSCTEYMILPKERGPCLNVVLNIRER